MCYNMHRKERTSRDGGNMNNIVKNKVINAELVKLAEKYGIYGLVFAGATTAMYLLFDKALERGYDVKADLKNLKFKFTK